MQNISVLFLFTMQENYKLPEIQDLEPQIFENLVFDIIRDMNFHNVVWRTPGSDGGRDIEALRMIIDPTFGTHVEKWFIECKKYENSISWPLVYDKLSHAETLEADYLFLLTTSSMSPQCIDRINTWNNSRRLVKIRAWGNHDLITYLRHHAHIALKYGLKAGTDKFLTMSGVALELTKIMSTIDGLHRSRRNSDNAIYYASSFARCWTERCNQIDKHKKFYILPRVEINDLYLTVNNLHPSQNDVSWGDELTLMWLNFVLEGKIAATLTCEGFIVVDLQEISENTTIKSTASLRIIEFLSGCEIQFTDLNIQWKSKND